MEKITVPTLVTVWRNNEGGKMQVFLKFYIKAIIFLVIATCNARFPAASLYKMSSRNEYDNT